MYNSDDGEMDCMRRFKYDKGIPDHSACTYHRIDAHSMLMDHEEREIASISQLHDPNDDLIMPIVGKVYNSIFLSDTPIGITS